MLEQTSKNNDSSVDERLDFLIDLLGESSILYFNEDGTLNYRLIYDELRQWLGDLHDLYTNDKVSAENAMFALNMALRQFPEMETMEGV